MKPLPIIVMSAPPSTLSRRGVKLVTKKSIMLSVRVSGAGVPKTPEQPGVADHVAVFAMLYLNVAGAVAAPSPA
jgi:hypothetical protein